MPNRERSRKEVAQESAPAWMVTYGDMMGLLLCFFVLLASFSAISQNAFEAAIASIQGALGAQPAQQSKIEITPIPTPAQQEKAESVESVARELRRRLQLAGSENDVTIEFDKQGGLKISFPSRILFDTARADLKSAAFSVLNDVASLLTNIPDAFIEVRGHTDSRPLVTTTRYRDNYDLSYARADAVARYLNRAGGIPISQFEIIACGPSQPIATNDTEEGQQANRRVEIYVRGEPNDNALRGLQQRMNTPQSTSIEPEGAAAPQM